MFEHRDPSGNRFKTYEIDANDCELFEGERLVPGQEIGTDIRSGMAICIDFWGQVATVYYNPMNDSFLVMIHRISDKKTERTHAGGREGLIPVPA
jgi:hypothetical protein